ncbi:hypothetical protein Sgou_51800 [Streptomyces gougerotii]|uniref:Uncharacterized protein n=1 Tax=Streptomyces gougerotii TaxID=53448 RepID=A0A8H9LLU1_9ACTN|nr:hypothetical protein Sgou_51800 [Streptomyces gougerotii]GGU71443.1 hypothetical protein GCM10010227_27130 [Streptomyces gougerotii]
MTRAALSKRLLMGVWLDRRDGGRAVLGWGGAPVPPPGVPRHRPGRAAPDAGRAGSAEVMLGIVNRCS